MKYCKWASSRIIKYSASSLVSSVAEEGIFLLLTWCLSEGLTGFTLTLIPLLVARLVSCLLNFEVNRRLVFQSQKSVGVALLLYFAQAIPLAVMQLVLTFGAYWLFGIGEEQIVLRGVIYAIVMALLFVVGFLVQKLWVFAVTEKAERGQKQ